MSVPTKNIYNELKKIEPIMDFSNYPPDHELYSKKRENALSYFKNEMPGVDIESFVGLKSKVYAIKTKNSEKKKV